MTVSTTFFTLEEVAANHSSKSLWVIRNNKDDHPGGGEILLQFGGKDITQAMHDPNEHMHSESAYDVLEDFYIGEVVQSQRTKKSLVNDTTASNKSVDPFIDIHKPMVYQVWTSNWSKSYYLKMVHIPRHAKHTAPFFGSKYLEVFTTTPWWLIPIFWVPIASYCMIDALRTLSPKVGLACFIMGLLNWTFIEYGLHRFLFHVDEYLPDNRVGITMHFLMHGVHHFLPMDRWRLVMPPALGFALAYPIWWLYVLSFPGGFGQGMMSGSLIGFVIYDLIHYYLHHGGQFISHLKEMKSYHMDHHYKDPNLGFGITSKLWDYLFSTTL
ncbi:hypothetical protein BDV3_005221 [Batrachochytrium dendrobatidis]|uniref:Ceramide very long chain fatty acid hydroxylase n=1 Tax=Batrachochytrium dendrobatidis (strain JEL423) TaxID=403673 RepID=A0A177WHX4_BATDL|nr:hypothetical protein BDEG_23237 [Batrachochytrium dendrobatidis JEL423]